MIDPKKIDQHVEQVIEGQTAGRVQRLLRSRMGLWIVAAISFFESAMPVPLITDPFMVAAILADRSRSVVVVLVTTISSILGGLAAFAMAAYFFEVIQRHLMTTDIASAFQSKLGFAASDTLITTLTGAVTPFPYTVTAWVVAVAGGGVWIFLVGSVIGRSFRYAVVGYCTYTFGPAALRYARRSLAVTSVVVLGLVAVYIWLKL